jgi:hypothetical protein
MALRSHFTTCARRGIQSAATTCAFALAMFSSPLLYAKPPGAKVFCEVYPNAPACTSGETTCVTCHTAPPALNLFGAMVSKNLAQGVTRPLSDEAYSAALPDALRALDNQDADGDLASNGDEIRAGTDPANIQSKPGDKACSNVVGATLDLCGYDVAYAYRKAMLDFCGRSASFDERKKFMESKTQRSVLHTTLNTCLASEFWRGRNGALWNLASAKIRPIQSIKSGTDAGPVPLADYYNDYALFVYAVSGDRDARDLLRAQYLVEASEQKPTTYTRFERTTEKDLAERGASGETAQTEQRVGMISSFTSVPRTTAAQAYRAYLGLDIALLQGLQPKPQAELIDYDNKGIRAPGCISCHQTLDPLAYPFSRYEGIDTDDKSFTQGFSAYRPDRMQRFVALEGKSLLNVPEEGMLLGKPVRNLVEWGSVASDSDAFAQKLALDLWGLILGSDPSPKEMATYTKLWQRLRNENGYQVEKLIHDLIDTEAYGAP